MDDGRLRRLKPAEKDHMRGAHILLAKVGSLLGMQGPGALHAPKSKCINALSAAMPFPVSLLQPRFGRALTFNSSRLAAKCALPQDYQHTGFQRQANRGQRAAGGFMWGRGGRQFSLVQALGSLSARNAYNAPLASNPPSTFPLDSMLFWSPM
jgi:hypothetical protein